MDGNNRWSKKYNVGKYESYKKGANKLIEINKFIFKNYILSMYLHSHYLNIIKKEDISDRYN